MFYVFDGWISNGHIMLENNWLKNQTKPFFREWRAMLKMPLGRYEKYLGVYVPLPQDEKQKKMVVSDFLDKLPNGEPRKYVEDDPISNLTSDGNQLCLIHRAKVKQFYACFKSESGKLILVDDKYAHLLYGATKVIQEGHVEGIIKCYHQSDLFAVVMPVRNYGEDKASDLLEELNEKKD
ncbi:MAG: hypothetical protein V1720_11585 [bacterium]